MLSALTSKVASIIAWCGLLVVVGPAGHTSGSLLDLNIEYDELKVAFENVRNENAELRKALSVSEKRIAELRSNLAGIGDETEIFKRQAMQMKLRIDALGLNGSANGSTTLEQRLLNAVSDLRVATLERKKCSEALARLSDAAALYAKRVEGGDPSSRSLLEAEIRNATTSLGGGTSPSRMEAPVPTAITEGLVISVKDDLALVVMNLGSRHGVRVGMPFQVIREAKPIGIVRIVDVREKIAGALIQHLNNEKSSIKVGDHLRVDAEQ